MFTWLSYFLSIRFSHCSSQLIVINTLKKRKNSLILHDTIDTTLSSQDYIDL